MNYYNKTALAFIIFLMKNEKKKKGGQTLTHMIFLHNYFTPDMLIISIIYAPTDLSLMLQGTKVFSI